MKTKLILAAACCLPLSLLAQKGFTVKGKVGTQNAPAMAYLSYTNDGEKVTDSTMLHKGTFTFKGVLSAPTQAAILIKHDTITRPRFSRQDDLYFYLENSTITVTAKDSVQYATVKGSVSNEDDKTLRAMREPFMKASRKIMAEYNAKTPEERKDSAWIIPTRALMASTQKGYDSVSRVFMATHMNSHISLLVFKEVDLAYNFNPDTATARFERFPASLRESATGKKLWEAIETGKKTDVGKMALEFTQKDSTGKDVKLTDFRGQYVLLDFWASWCKPCRAENPNYLAAYNKFKSKNFTILGVSLDDENGRRAWLHAVNQDGMPWTQVSDLEGFKSKAAVMYGVNAIPTNFLIDPNGKIVAKNLRGDELDKKLSALLN